jgi:hypothetical protein
MGWDWVHSVLRPLFSLLYQPQMIDDGDCWAISGMRIGSGNRSTRRKPPPSVTLSTTNPTWPDPGLNPGRCCGNPETIRLSYGTAFVSTYFRTVMYCDVCWEYGQEIEKRWPGEGDIHSRDCPSSRAELVSWRHHQKPFNVPNSWAFLWRSDTN